MCSRVFNSTVVAGFSRPSSVRLTSLRQGYGGPPTACAKAEGRHYIKMKDALGHPAEEFSSPGIYGSDHIALTGPPFPPSNAVMLSDLSRDFRYALRALLRAPTFAATVIATLALGIGANSVIFSAVDAVLLRDAPVSDPDSLVDVYTSSGNNLYSNSSYPDYFDLRDSGTFASLAAYTPVSITMDANGQPEPLAGQLVSGNYFEVLGVTIPFGRGFDARRRSTRGARSRGGHLACALAARVQCRPVVDRPDDSSQQQPVHAHRCRTTRVRRSAPRSRDGRLGSNRASARSGSAVSGGAARARSFGDLRPAPFERIEHGGPAAEWRQHRPGGVAR